MQASCFKLCLDEFLPEKDLHNRVLIGCEAIGMKMFDHFHWCGELVLAAQKGLSQM